MVLPQGTVQVPPVEAQRELLLLQAPAIRIEKDPITNGHHALCIWYVVCKAYHRVCMMFVYTRIPLCRGLLHAIVVQGPLAFRYLRPISAAEDQPLILALSRTGAESDMGHQTCWERANA